MADEIAVDELTQQEPNTVDATGTNGGEPERKFTQEDLDKFVADRLVQERRQAEIKTKKATDAAQAQALAEQGKYEELYKATQAQLADAQRAAADAQHAIMRRDVAAKVNLPAPLIDRLRGETFEELEDDAKALLAALPKPSAPNINGAAGNGRTPGTAAMSEEDIKELAAVLNVNPKYLRP